jgi:transglutaminase-like putative cysteine protease
MRRLALVSLFLSGLVSISAASKSYLGMFMQGTRIGYSVGEVSDDTQYGATKRSDSSTIMAAGLLGADVNVVIRSVTWTNAKGAPLRMEFSVESAGRTQKTVATFTSDSIKLAIDNSGQTSERTIPLPKDGRVVDDAASALMADGVKPGAKQIYYVLDPMTTSLVRNEATLVGKSNVMRQGQTFAGTEIRIEESRATTRIFLDASGNLIKMAGPMGIEMWPVTEAEALAPFGDRPPQVDLAYGTKVDVKGLSDPGSLAKLKLKITGGNLSRLPTSTHQTVTKTAKGWTVELHPVGIKTDTTIAASAKAKPAFLKPSMNIPADDAEMKKLAKEMIGDAKTVALAAKRVRTKVFTMMRPNAGIGVLRDAREVLKTKEGVCRDYATLAATLLRAGGVPTRLASGLVFQDGAFYYHAWVEVWDGVKWFGVDPTRDENVGAGHIILSQGSVEEAFTFSLLEDVTMEVIHATRRK